MEYFYQEGLYDFTTVVNCVITSMLSGESPSDR